MRRTLAIITARAGSKGLPGKNMIDLNGKPLIQYTIEAALNSNLEAKDICISTDDLAIIELAQSMGLEVPFVRPAHLASDTASSAEVLNHAVEFYQNSGEVVDDILLLQPTSPFRNARHINEALGVYQELKDSDPDLQMLFSTYETKSNPYFVLFEENEAGYLQKSKESDATRRQDVPKVWQVNGALYIIDRQAFMEFQTIAGLERIKAYPMSQLDSVDIDTELDLRMAEMLFNINKGE